MAPRFKQCTLILEVAAVIGAAASAWGATPCDGFHRFTSKRKAAFETEIAKQLPAKTVEILQSFQANTWRIFYVDTHVSDEAYVFYAHDPHKSRYITLWSGAATDDEAQAIREWTLENVPGIPPGLARCFAWQVTEGRK